MKAALLTLAVIILGCVLAPVYAGFAGTDPFRSNINGVVDGQDVLAENEGLGTTPIGPGWRGAYLLGADALGRDVAARLLYGGRTSLIVAGCATLLCLGIGGAVGVLAGFAAGAVDAALAGLLDLVWAFPAYLLAISLSIVLISQDLAFGPVTVGADGLLLPIVILGIVFVPYVARPIRAEVLTLRGAEFMEAARATGGGPWHRLRRHVLPHVRPVLLGFAPIVMAMTLLTEAALSILSIGVQAPGASWGTLLADGQNLLYTRPVVALAPGVLIAATVLSLNRVAEALR